MRADDLHLETMQDELLGGKYYIPEQLQHFSAKVEGEDIMFLQCVSLMKLMPVNDDCIPAAHQMCAHKECHYTLL